MAAAEPYILRKISGSHKYQVQTPGDSVINFGAAGYSDYLHHKDPDRKRRYVLRHQSRESWGIRGISTAGFWSKHILWNKPTLRESIRDTEARFNIKIHLARK